MRNTGRRVRKPGKTHWQIFFFSLHWKFKLSSHLLRPCQVFVRKCFDLSPSPGNFRLRGKNMNYGSKLLSIFFCPLETLLAHFLCNPITATQSLLGLAHRCFICRCICMQRCRFCNCIAMCPQSTWPGPLPGIWAGGGPSALEASCIPTPPSTSLLTFQRFCESAAISEQLNTCSCFIPRKSPRGTWERGLGRRSGRAWQMLAEVDWCFSTENSRGNGVWKEKTTSRNDRGGRKANIYILDLNCKNWLKHKHVDVFFFTSSQRLMCCQE